MFVCTLYALLIYNIVQSVMIVKQASDPRYTGVQVGRHSRAAGTFMNHKNSFCINFPYLLVSVTVCTTIRQYTRCVYYEYTTYRS